MPHFRHLAVNDALPLLCVLFCVAGAANVGMSKWLPALPWATGLVYLGIRKRGFARVMLALGVVLCGLLYGAQHWAPQLYWTGFGATIELEQPTVAYDNRMARTLSCQPPVRSSAAYDTPAIHVPPGAYRIVAVESSGGIDSDYRHSPVVRTPVGDWPVVQPSTLPNGKVFNYSCVNAETFPRFGLRRWAEIASFPMYYPFVFFWLLSWK